MRRGAWRSGVAAALSLAGVPAAAGPPFLTDDPQPTDTRHWEIYTFASGTGTAGRFDATTGLDLNYGALPGVQLTATLPVDLGAPVAFGDAEAGIKYRFVRREKAGFAMAIFPRAILPTAPSPTPRRIAFLLPVWAQQDLGPWSIFGGGGLTLAPGAGNRNYWQAALAVTRALDDRLLLGAEVFHRGSDAIDGRPYTALNFGAIRKLGGPFALLLSGGPGIGPGRDAGRFNVYAALQTVF